jgi:hypothetical protein
MTTMISIDGKPVAIIGATRYYLTDALETLTDRKHRATIVGLCEALTRDHAYRPLDASEPRKARTD